MHRVDPEPSQAELARAEGILEAASLASDALAIAEAEGHLQSAGRLRELADHD